MFYYPFLTPRSKHEGNVANLIFPLDLPRCLHRALALPEKNLGLPGYDSRPYPTPCEGRLAGRQHGFFSGTAAQLGIRLTVHDSQNDVNNQIAAFHTSIEDPEVNVIILAALEMTGWDDVLMEARASGKIVILQDFRIDARTDLYATYVGPDFVEEGRMAAEALCKLLGSGEGKTVWELVGNIGSAVAKDRGQGFREKMGEFGIVFAGPNVPHWSITEGKQLVEDLVKETTDIQGLFAQHDELALGAIEAIKEAGLRPGNDIKIVSIDGTRSAFDAMLAGELNATVECNPRLGPLAFDAALRALNGEELPKWIRIEEEIFYADMPDLLQIASSRTY